MLRSFLSILIGCSNLQPIGILKNECSIILCKNFCIWSVQAQTYKKISINLRFANFYALWLATGIFSTNQSTQNQCSINLCNNFSLYDQVLVGSLAAMPFSHCTLSSTCLICLWWTCFWSSCHILFSFCSRQPVRRSARGGSWADSQFASRWLAEGCRRAFDCLWGGNFLFPELNCSCCDQVVVK